jgi:hypothetical protein
MKNMNVIKCFGLVILTLFASLGFFVGIGSFAAERVELKLTGVLSPTLGFDDNDQVQVVVHGMLPNACYTVGPTMVLWSKKKTNEATIRQFGVLQTEGICATRGEQLPPHMMMAIPYTKVITVGRLESGKYRFNYKAQKGSPRGMMKSREIEIVQAQVPAVDSLPYAAVSTAFVPDVVFSGSDLEIKLSGVLNNNCTKLDENVKVEKQGDVIVLLPTVSLIEGVVCAQALIPFEKKVNLGKQLEGYYLIHTRSMNGQAVNHVVDVFSP